jgi:uncharacterized protein (TIGR01777 family)
MKFVISGGSGFIGSHLTPDLVRDGHEVVVLTRGEPATKNGVRYVNWDGKSPDGAWTVELRGADGIINLAGADVGGGRWTRRRMAYLIASRVTPTSAIVGAIERTPAGERPAVLVSAAGIDIYGDRRDDQVVTEGGPQGDSFLARMGQLWEAEAEKAEALGVRVARIRTAMVFGREAPAFRLLTLPVRFFIGPLGDGRQWFTWIHIDDLVGIYRLALQDGRMSGPINAVAPDVRRQRDLAREMGRVLHRPAVIPAPAPLLRLALGQESELLLHGRRAAPAKAQAAGYAFRFGGLPEALENLLGPR